MSLPTIGPLGQFLEEFNEKGISHSNMRCSVWMSFSNRFCIDVSKSSSETDHMLSKSCKSKSSLILKIYAFSEPLINLPRNRHQFFTVPQQDASGHSHVPLRQTQFS